MKFFKIYQAVLAAAFLALAVSVVPALAVTNSGGGAVAVPYVAAFTPAFGISGMPYAGTMQLVMQNGTITGTYTGISVRPDRLNDRITPVTGAMNLSDGHMQFYVGRALSFTGTMYADGTISGTAAYNGRLFDFMAKPGSPGKPL